MEQKYLNTFWRLKNDPSQFVYVYKAQSSSGDRISLSFYVVNATNCDLEVLDNIEFRDGELEEKNTRVEPSYFIDLFKKCVDVWGGRLDYLKVLNDTHTQLTH